MTGEDRAVQAEDGLGLQVGLLEPDRLQLRLPGILRKKRGAAMYNYTKTKVPTEREESTC